MVIAVSSEAADLVLLQDAAQVALGELDAGLHEHVQHFLDRGLLGGLGLRQPASGLHVDALVVGEHPLAVGDELPARRRRRRRARRAGR
jgi:hypothetical protein